MVNVQRTLYVVILDDASSNSGASVYGVTSHEDWAKSFCSRFPPQEIPSLGHIRYDPYLLDDPEVFTEAREQEGGQ